MPTPRPTIATAAVVKSGMSMKRAHDQHDRDAGADAEQRGADRQPHREHRAERDQQDDHRREEADRLAGAARPRSSANMSPPNSIVEPGHVDVWSPSCLISLPSSVSSSPERSAKLTSAYAICAVARRSAGRPPRSTGSRRRRRRSSRSISAKRPSIALCDRGVVDALRRPRTRSGAWTWRLRKLDFSSRSNAAWLSVPGSLNSVLNAPPTALASTKVPTSRTIQPTSTHGGGGTSCARVVGAWGRTSRSSGRERPG